MSTSQTTILAQVRKRLYLAGFTTVTRSPGRALAFLVDNRRVEVRSASPNARGMWQFNLHRHGKLDESNIDAYIFCLSKIPGVKGSMPLYLILRAPLGKSTIAFTFATLTRTYAGNVDDWDAIKAEGKKRKVAA